MSAPKGKGAAMFAPRSAKRGPAPSSRTPIRRKPGPPDLLRRKALALAYAASSGRQGAEAAGPTTRSEDSAPERSSAASRDSGAPRPATPTPRPFPAAGVPAQIQAKLEVGATDDPQEHEADRVADRVMRQPAPGDSGECATCAGERPRLRAKPADPSAPARSAPESVARTLGSSGRPLEPAARSFFEPRLGHDLGAVRIHDDARAATSAVEIGARAYTHGTHIAFADNQYRPGTSSGRRLLAHELAHVVQQSGTSYDAGGGAGISRSPAADMIARQPGPLCGPSGRLPGNVKFQGTAEHMAIEADFLAFVAPGSGMVEYTIPQSSAKGNTGYADMVDTAKNMIYEIKPLTQAANGVTEAKRYVEMANKHCPPKKWSLGTAYPIRTLPFGGALLVAEQLLPAYPGVVIYEKRAPGDPVYEPENVPLPQSYRQPGFQSSKQPVKKEQPKQKVPELQPTVYPIPPAAMDKILEFIQWAVETAQDVDKAVQDFLDKHPELAEIIATASVLVMVATIVEDIVTLGAGIADDPATLAIAWKLWDVAMVMMERRAMKQLLTPRTKLQL